MTPPAAHRFAKGIGVPGIGVEPAQKGLKRLCQTLSIELLNEDIRVPPVATRRSTKDFILPRTLPENTRPNAP